VSGCSLSVDLESPPLVKELIKKNTGSDRDINGVTAAEHRDTDREVRGLDEMLRESVLFTSTPLCMTLTIGRF
jgi:hypothetical protein